MYIAQFNLVAYLANNIWLEKVWLQSDKHLQTFP